MCISQQHLTFIVTSALMTAWSSMARAQELKPFAVVKDFCPDCPKPEFDKIKLKGGRTVQAVVVAENPVFYVLVKHGELRAIGRDKVESIDRSSTAQRDVGHYDQILLKDGGVLSGRIVNERIDNGLFEIEVPPLKTTIYAYKPAIAMVFKSGKQYYPPSP